jgi:hypothetical protein
MAHFWKRLRSGEWLTASRARPVGTDFSNTYAAGTLAFYDFTPRGAMLDRSGFIVGARSVAQA